MLSISVDYAEERYTMRSAIWFDASVEQVYEVFRYWENSSKFSSAIVESRDLPPDDLGRPGFWVKNQGCVLFFCKSFVRQGYLEAEQNVMVKAFVDPELSDFYFSHEIWTFEARDGGTVVIYDLEMSPKFWIPPAIGPYLIKRKLRKSGGRAIGRIESLAQAVVTDVTSDE